MSEQIVQILERDDCSCSWKIKTVIQIWPKIPEERERLDRFLNEKPEERQ